MSQPSATKAALDEKIALIREKNKQIIERNELIQKEIKIAKKYNAMVTTKTSKTSDDDSNPTLYSDKIEKPRTNFRKSNVHVNPEYFQSQNNCKSNVRSVEDCMWRAERNRIDRERINRQRADSGWKREWDADKSVIEDKRIQRNTLATHNTSVRDKQNHRPSQSHCFQNTHTESTAPHPTGSRGRGRSSLNNGTKPSNQVFSERSDSNIQSVLKNKIPEVKVSFSTPKLERTIEVNEVVSEKSVPKVKRVSWKNENLLIDSSGIFSKDDGLKNIKVQVNNSENANKPRTIKMSGNREPSCELKSILKFDEETSFNIKDCVIKTAFDQLKISELNNNNSVSTHNSKINSSALGNLEKTIENCTIFSKKPVEVTHILQNKSKSDLKQCNVDINVENDEEWEDFSDEEWEDVSDED